MNDVAIYLLYLACGVGIGAGACYVWATHHITSMRAKVVIAEHRAEIISEHQEVAVRVEPYVNIAKESGWLKKTTTVEIGYQYQLFVRGLPCFDPHKIITDSRQESEINDAGIERLKAHASDLAQLAISSTPVGRAAKLISVAGALVSKQK